jgi:predicted metalloprotease with PDZ domain
MHRLPRRRLYFVAAVLAAAISSGASLPAKDASPPIRIAVDLREAPRRIFHARLQIPAAPGSLTLVYPKWIPGEHMPSGPIADLVGLKFFAGGKPLTWRRDDVDMYAFHLEVPAGADSVEAHLDYLSPVRSSGYSGGASATAELAVLNWNLVLLYPQGYKTDDLTFAASLRLPDGWKFGTALPVASESSGEIEFQQVSLTTLVDSPVISGTYFHAVALTPGETSAHRLNLAGDSAAAVAISPELVAHFKQLTAEAGALFGARHYRHYDFLLALSDHVRPSGLEHHESSDNRARARALLDPDIYMQFAGLLPHEFVHSWNGKYRRPAGLATPDYQQPMRGDLLWVYEGLTQYLGDILTARSGLRTPEAYREHLAWVGAYLDHWPGRTWRPLEDTAVAAQILYGRPSAWGSWRRGADFYDESLLIWLEADALIRQQTQGRRSMDDFCRRFHGGASGAPAVVTYTFDDVVAAMNEVAAYDWRSFLRARLNSTGPRAPLGGLEASGWRLVYTDAMNQYLRSVEKASEQTDLRFSIGLILRHEENTNEDGTILDVIPGTPAALAGIGPDMKLIAVNGRRWSPAILREAVRAAKGTSASIDLLVENVGSYKTYRLDYHDGERYPHLVRDASRPDLLEQIIHPRATREALATGTPK